VAVLDEEDDPVTRGVIGAAIEVHRLLGPGLLESIYHRCLSHELTLRGIGFESLVRLPITYKGVKLGEDLVIDMTVAGRVVLELKAVAELEPVHEAQLFTYMKLSAIPLGLLINFNVRYLKDGIRRRILTL
jgi:GxxExxY protein